MNGEMRLMCEVEDETFAQCMLGDGVAIEPSEGKLYSPCNGKVARIVPDSGDMVEFDQMIMIIEE